jgi:hypothetical protein
MGIDWICMPRERAGYMVLVPRLFQSLLRLLVGLTGVVKLENVFNGFRFMIAAIKLIRTILRTSRTREENMG